MPRHPICQMEVAEEKALSIQCDGQLIFICAVTRRWPSSGAARVLDQKKPKTRADWLVRLGDLYHQGGGKAK